MGAWQNYLTMMERKAQKLPGLARNLWWFGVQYRGIYYLGDFHWIQSLLFSHPPKFFQLICTFVPLLAVQIICPAVSPVCYANAWLPLCILPPHPRSSAISIVIIYHQLVFLPRSWSCIFRLRPPISSIEILLVEIMSFIADIFLPDDDVSCWINVLIWW